MADKSNIGANPAVPDYTSPGCVFCDTYVLPDSDLGRSTERIADIFEEAMRA